MTESDTSAEDCFGTENVSVAKKILLNNLQKKIRMNRLVAHFILQSLA